MGDPVGTRCRLGLQFPDDSLATLRIDLQRIEIVYFGGALAAKRSAEEHDQVLDNLEARDLEAAGAAIERNWRASFERLGKRLDQQVATT